MRINSVIKSTFLVILLLILCIDISIVASSAEKREGDSCKATGFFHLAEIDGVWWFIDPDGEKFYSIGLLGVNPGQFFNGNFSQWVQETRGDS